MSNKSYVAKRKSRAKTSHAVQNSKLTPHSDVKNSKRNAVDSSRNDLRLRNGLLAGSTLASIGLASAAAIFSAPLIMGIAVGMAGIAATAAVSKLRMIKPFLDQEQKPLHSHDSKEHQVVTTH